ncbi:unnamed protein product [Linum trigynum]|uniref:CCHC-type domain-containing protein n=1 Tax=Linum trigynum TaxID=586398 RepID=A0AAV2FJ79_9ROSI
MAEEIVEKLSGIDLTEDEEALICIDESVTSEGVEEAIKELGVAGKVVSGRFPSEKILKRILSEAWKLRREFDVQVTKSNILRIQLYCYEDKNKILYGGPWHLERQLLIFKEIPPDLDLERIDFSTADFWIRIRKLPLKLRNDQMAKRIGNMFGALIRWDELHSSVSSDYMRIRVSLSITKPLRRVVKLQGAEGQASFRVGYERLPIYCFRCGIFGHLKKSCTNGMDPNGKDEDPYGPWLRADSPLRKIPLEEKGKQQRLTKLWEEVKAAKSEKEKMAKETIVADKALCVYEDLSRETREARVKDKDREESQKNDNKGKDSVLDLPTTEQAEANEKEDRRVDSEQGEQGHLPQLSFQMGQKGVDRRKWMRLARKHPANGEQDQIQSAMGKRGAPEAMDVDEIPVVEKRPRGITINDEDGEVADLAEEQGRRA